ncbi:DUF2878 domain-containing protein [Vibrio taketomensis]|uniref:DUF2878 domain-containing protein n=1 Tax=Vibrio taketomensis TaxID=2572923 RepID=UPI0013895906|nr:DUF2878 domain-containing protein [Vibrio taketomensis]
MSAIKQLVIVSTIFQIVWFMAVLGRETWQWFTLATIAVILLITAVRCQFRWRVWLLLIIVGVSVDVLNIVFGVLVFDTTFFPLWLLGLWVTFFWYAQFLALVLSQYPLPLVSIIGGVAGAVSYVAGYKLGAVTLGLSSVLAFVVFFIEWTLLVALIMKVVNREGKNHGKDSMA